MVLGMAPVTKGWETNQLYCHRRSRTVGREGGSQGGNESGRKGGLIDRRTDGGRKGGRRGGRRKEEEGKGSSLASS